MDIKNFDFENIDTGEYYNFLQEDALHQFTSALVENGYGFDVRRDSLWLNLRKVDTWKVFVRSKRSENWEKGMLSDEEIAALLGGLAE